MMDDSRKVSTIAGGGIVWLKIDVHHIRIDVENELYILALTDEEAHELGQELIQQEPPADD